MASALERSCYIVLEVHWRPQEGQWVLKDESRLTTPAGPPTPHTHHPGLISRRRLSMVRELVNGRRALLSIQLCQTAVKRPGVKRHSKMDHWVSSPIRDDYSYKKTKMIQDDYDIADLAEPLEGSGAVMLRRWFRLCRRADRLDEDEEQSLDDSFLSATSGLMQLRQQGLFCVSHCSDACAAAGDAFQCGFFCSCVLDLPSCTQMDGWVFLSCRFSVSLNNSDSWH